MAAIDSHAALAAKAPDGIMSSGPLVTRRRRPAPRPPWHVLPSAWNSKGNNGESMKTAW